MITQMNGMEISVLVGDSSVGSVVITAINGVDVDVLIGGVRVANQVNTDGLPINDKITGWTKHGTERALDRDGGIGVSNDAIIDAVNNPVKPPITQSGETTRFVGENATVVLNQDGEVVTTWPRGKGGVRND